MQYYLKWGLGYVLNDVFIFLSNIVLGFLFTFLSCENYSSWMSIEILLSCEFFIVFYERNNFFNLHIFAIKITFKFYYFCRSFERRHFLGGKCSNITFKYSERDRLIRKVLFEKRPNFSTIFWFI